MDTTVKVQDMFSFSKLPIIILGILVIAYIVYIIADNIIKSNKGKARKKPIRAVKRKPVDIDKLRIRYISMLDNVEQQFTSNQIDIRESYLRMSEIIRLFVFDVTGIKVQNCSLTDISRLNMPELTLLMQEYYVPEFAEKSEGDVLASLNKTKKAIEKWN